MENEHKPDFNPLKMPQRRHEHVFTPPPIAEEQVVTDQETSSMEITDVPILRGKSLGKAIRRAMHEGNGGNHQTRARKPGSGKRGYYGRVQDMSAPVSVD